MIRRIALTAALALSPAVALAQTMPQMDFHNPLTLEQVTWMAVILVVLYFTLSRWGLPEIGKVLAHRDAVIAGDLEAARAAKAKADETVAALTRTMNNARGTAQAEIAKAVDAAKAKAREDAHALQAKLDAQLAQADAQIEAARNAALAAIKPVAAETAATILAKLTGKTPEPAALSSEIDTAYAARQAA